jgi:hypothetical protein
MTDYTHRARSAASTAGAATRRAEKNAHRAAEAYRTARHFRQHAAQLTMHWSAGSSIHNPAAACEANAVAWAGIGDAYLHSSFHETGQAEFYHKLAADYRALAAGKAQS